MRMVIVIVMMMMIIVMDEMYQFFYDMIKNIESLPRNNFKKSAEIEMKKMIEIASEMRENRDSEFSLKFSFC